MNQGKDMQGQRDPSHCEDRFTPLLRIQFVQPEVASSAPSGRYAADFEAGVANLVIGELCRIWVCVCVLASVNS